MRRRSARRRTRLEQGANAKISKAAERNLEVIDGGKAGAETTIYRARTAKAVQDARRAEIEVKRMLGTVVDRDEVKREAHAAGRVLVQRLLAIPSRVAPLVAVEIDDRKCRKIIEDEVRAAIVEFQDMLAAL